jgi:hypothetical protein
MIRQLVLKEQSSYPALGILLHLPKQAMLSTPITHDKANVV